MRIIFLRGQVSWIPLGEEADPVIISTLPGSLALCLPAVGTSGELHYSIHLPDSRFNGIVRAGTGETTTELSLS
jgi:D-alanyl-D-alanine carboxypeptidase